MRTLQTPRTLPYQSLPCSCTPQRCVSSIALPGAQFREHDSVPCRLCGVAEFALACEGHILSVSQLPTWSMCLKSCSSQRKEHRIILIIN